jgi:hypothetical protein
MRDNFHIAKYPNFNNDIISKYSELCVFFLRRKYYNLNFCQIINKKRCICANNGSLSRLNLIDFKTFDGYYNYMFTIHRYRGEKSFVNTILSSNLKIDCDCWQKSIEISKNIFLKMFCSHMIEKIVVLLDEEV